MKFEDFERQSYNVPLVKGNKKKRKDDDEIKDKAQNPYGNIEFYLIYIAFCAFKFAN